MNDSRIFDVLRSKDSKISLSDLRNILLDEKERLQPDIFSLYDKLDWDFSEECYSDQYCLGVLCGKESMLTALLLLLHHVDLS